VARQKLAEKSGHSFRPGFASFLVCRLAGAAEDDDLPNYITPAHKALPGKSPQPYFPCNNSA
jgi:hypothetical protein